MGRSGKLLFIFRELFDLRENIFPKERDRGSEKKIVFSDAFLRIKKNFFLELSS